MAESLKSWFNKTGRGMIRIIDGLYVGNARNANDKEQLLANKITHIVSVHDCPKKRFECFQYLCIPMSDNCSTQLKQYFPQVHDFIHKARLEGGNVLVHCLVGQSRSVSFIISYLMVISESDFHSCLSSVQAVHPVADPNLAFRMQLVKFGNKEAIDEERSRLKARFISMPWEPENVTKEMRSNFIPAFVRNSTNIPESQDVQPLVNCDSMTLNASVAASQNIAHCQ